MYNEDIERHPYAQYGVISRKLNFQSASGCSYIVISKGRPSWFWATKAWGFEVQLVVLEDPFHIKLIKHLSPSSEFLIRRGFNSFGWPRVDMVFSNTRISGHL
jgi:hypothetical protein